MRRWFHCLLIGVLTCSLSVDTAKACWYLRRAHAACGGWRPMCPPPATWPTYSDVVIGNSVCCGEAACGSAVIADVWQDDVCCGGTSGIIVDSLAVRHAESVVLGEAVVVAEPTPPVAPPAPQPALQEGIAATAPAVPELKPAVDAAPAVETVAALEPAAADAVPELKPSEPAPAEPAVPPVPAAAPEPPAVQAEPNIFEEVEAAADAALLDPASTEPPAAPAVDPTDAAAASSADPLFAEPAVTPDAVAADEPPADPATDPAAEDAPAPAADEPASPPAIDEADPLDGAAREPLRRWVDDTGSYATVGMLLDVRADGVAIRKANGRTVIVPLERLSEHDRAYAADAGARLAAERPPSSRETAGL